jgi:hypothetical protein
MVNYCDEEVMGAGYTRSSWSDEPMGGLLLLRDNGFHQWVQRAAGSKRRSGK